MQSIDINELTAALDRSGHVYHEFIREQTLSVGLALWPAGSVDDQTPHTEDEVYYVVGGRATIRVGAEEQPVRPGSVVYVAAGVEHQFLAIEEDLAVLVFWAPPRRSRRA